jgi:PAS domain S-box-containing protein
MNSKKIKDDNLRKKAEELLKNQFNHIKDQSKDDQHVHELRVHQIELELQNEELRDAQIKLEDSRRKYFDLYNFAPVGYFTLDKDRIILDLNLTGALLLGVEKLNIQKRAFIQFIDPNCRKQFYNHTMKVLETGTKQTVEIKLLKYDNASFYAHLETIKINDVNGNFKEFRTTVIDITSQKKAEVEKDSLLNMVQVERDKLTGLLNNISDEIWFADTNKKFTLANQSALQEFNLDSVDDLNVEELAMSLEVYRPDGNLRSVNETPSLRALKGEKVRKLEEIIFTPSSNELRYRQVNASPVKDDNDNIIGAVSVVRDITEQKKAEKTLIESEERLRLAQNLGNVGIWDWNTITNEIYFAPELERLYGVSPGTIKTYEDWRQFVNSKDIEKIEAERDQKIAEHKPFDLEFRILHKLGETRWISSKGGATYNKEGDILRVLGINTDITERINRVKELKAIMNKLEHSNMVLAQFAYITSHDLREPLRMITSFLQLLERRYKDQLDQDANEFIGFAVDGAKRLDAMINALLQLSKITTKKREITPVNFENVLKEALINMKVQIEENDAVITHDPLPIIKGDEKLNIQLFQNIIGNAIKYRSQETPKIHISTIKEKTQYLFSIKDNGIGMSPEHLKKIFTIFQRLHSKEEYEGTGIGLSIAEKIVHLQGGRIWVESELGKGSTFYFTIPI